MRKSLLFQSRVPTEVQVGREASQSLLLASSWPRPGHPLALHSLQPENPPHGAHVAPNWLPEHQLQLHAAGAPACPRPPAPMLTLTVASRPLSHTSRVDAAHTAATQHQRQDKPRACISEAGSLLRLSCLTRVTTQESPPIPVRVSWSCSLRFFQVVSPTLHTPRTRSVGIYLDT